MECIIKINMDNSAFEDEQELSRILKASISMYETGRTQFNLIDLNGNNIGTFEIKEA